MGFGTTSNKPEPPIDPVISDDEVTVAVPVEAADDLKDAFGKRNLDHLLHLDGATVLLDVCCNLPFLGRYTKRYKDAVAGSGFVFPNTLSEALTSRNR